jgi:hypothetical protein
VSHASADSSICFLNLDKNPKAEQLDTSPKKSQSDVSEYKTALKDIISYFQLKL